MLGSCQIDQHDSNTFGNPFICSNVGVSQGLSKPPTVSFTLFYGVTTVLVAFLDMIG